MPGMLAMFLFGCGVSTFSSCFLLGVKKNPAISNNGITDLRSKPLSDIECHQQFFGAPVIDESYSTPCELVYDRSVVPLPPFLPVHPGTHTHTIGLAFHIHSLQKHWKDTEHYALDVCFARQKTFLTKQFWWRVFYT